MGIWSPESALPGAAAAMVGRWSLVLLVLVLAVTMSLPLVRAAGSDVDVRPPPPPPDGDGSSEESSEDHDSCKITNCRNPTSSDTCLKKACELCCQLNSGDQLPEYCGSCFKDMSLAFFLVAKIALVAALVVAIAALMSVVIRSCTKRDSGRQRRPQMRTSAGSMTSADEYFTERLQDCPPCYDEIRWEKPPSYCSLQVLQENSTDGPARQGPSASSTDEASRSIAPSSPPPYGGIYTITQRVIQLQSSPTTNSDDDRGIVFNATPNTEESNRNKSIDEPKEITGTKTPEVATAAISQ